MADDCRGSTAAALAPEAVHAHATDLIRAYATDAFGTHEPCRCAGRMPVFDGLDPRYRRVL